VGGVVRAELDGDIDALGPGCPEADVRQGGLRLRHPPVPGLTRRPPALERIRDGAPVAFSFAGAIEARSGGHRGRPGRVRTQHRDTGGFARMDHPEAARAWARAELAGDAAAADRLAAAMFRGSPRSEGS